jgi:glycosyltransferase involved in cell wall biosynthesis
VSFPDTQSSVRAASDQERRVVGAVEVSVVIPCLNEEKSIGACVDKAREAIRKAGLVGEVVVADNGSTDKSAELAADRGARVVPVVLRGYGSAIRGGIDASLGDLIVIGDADGQHDFSMLPEFVARLREGYEVVIGNRFAGGMAPGSMTWSHRYIGNPLLSGFLRLLFHPGIHDAQGGFRALRREAYDAMDLRCTGFEFAPEMVIKAVRHGLRMTELPVTTLADQRDRAPHVRTVPDGWRHLSFILMCSPNWLFIAPGALLLAAGIADVTWLFVGPQHIGRVLLDTRAQLFGVLLAVLGFQIASIGLFARVFSYSEPFHTRARTLERALKSVKLEHGLMVGGLLILVGLIGGLWSCAVWASQGFGLFHTPRDLIFWTLWFLLGVQMCFASFFLSMLGVSRGIWIGERA